MSTITSVNARRYVDKAMAIADERQAPIAVVVVDRAGTIIAAARSDATAPIMVELARRKAALSAAVGAPTAVIITMAKTDATLDAGLRSVSDHLLLPGAIPVIGPGGVPEGAVGIAGGHYTVDQEICELTVRGDVPGVAKT
jgi:glc operon protein GlcG